MVIIESTLIVIMMTVVDPPKHPTVHLTTQLLHIYRIREEGALYGKEITVKVNLSQNYVQMLLLSQTGKVVKMKEKIEREEIIIFTPTKNRLQVKNRMWF